MVGEPAILLTAIAVAASASFAGATALVGRRFASDAAAASGAASPRIERAGGGEGRLRRGVFRVTFRKELRLLYRDIPLLAQVLLAGGLSPAPDLPSAAHRRRGRRHAPGPGVGAVAFVCGQVAGSLVWLTVSAEDAPELIGCAPASRRRHSAREAQRRSGAAGGA